MKDKKLWTFDDEANNRLNMLMGIVSPSMEEVSMANSLRMQWGKLGMDVQTDILGNVYASLCTEQDDRLNLGIMAHMDTVAVQVTRILPNGMLQVRHIGLLPHTLLGQPMKILTQKGIINGVIGFDPTSQYGQPKGLVAEDLWMDIGATDGEQTSQMVQIGDLAVLEPRLNEMGCNILCGTAIDDKIGLLILTECMKWFTDYQPSVNLHFIGSVQEEVGLRGSSVVPANKQLDACIVLDVDYATDTPASHENQMGMLCLGKGVGLHAKADNNPVLRRIAMKIAERENIAYQLTLGRFTYGGTDAAPMQIKLSGVATLNINIPCRYMHSPIEMCHKSDVESAVRLVVALVEELSHSQQKRFLPGID